MAAEVGAHALSEQDLHTLGVAVPDRVVQRRVAVVGALGVDLEHGAFQDGAQRIGAPGVGGLVAGSGLEQVVDKPGVGAGGEQLLDNLGVAEEAGDKQGCLAVIAAPHHGRPLVDVGPLGDKPADLLQVAGLHGVHQRLFRDGRGVSLIPRLECQANPVAPVFLLGR